MCNPEGAPCENPYPLSLDDLKALPRADPNATPGQIAYEAYVDASHGASLISGSPLPAWTDQDPKIRAAWELGAAAVCLEQIARLLDHGLLHEQP